MFPYSPNITFELLSICSVPDEIGTKKLKITSRKKVIGIIKSITASEYQTSISINKKMDMKISMQSFAYDDSKYALVKESIYKVERTYINGMFIELYLSLTEIKKEELE